MGSDRYDFAGLRRHAMAWPLCRANGGMTSANTRDLGAGMRVLLSVNK